jgi:hypothetical protein
MTETPSNLKLETLLAEYAERELHLTETPKMREIRERLHMIENLPTAIKNMGRYQDLGDIEAKKQGEFSAKAQIGMTILTARIYHNTGIYYTEGKNTRYIEALEDAFVFSMNEGFEDIQDKITEIEPSININDFDIPTYYSSRY